MCTYNVWLEQILKRVRLMRGTVIDEPGYLVEVFRESLWDLK
jgi:hypothetical protein